MSTDSKDVVAIVFHRFLALVLPVKTLNHEVQISIERFNEVLTRRLSNSIVNVSVLSSILQYRWLIAFVLIKITIS